jgi:hypothetical protein
MGRYMTELGLYNDQIERQQSPITVDSKTPNCPLQ